MTIGIVFSTVLVRYALFEKEKQLQGRPGNYQSGFTAFDEKAFPPLPPRVLDWIPQGIVVHFDFNQSHLNPMSSKSWVLETAGSFRSERLFILAEEFTENNSSKLSFFRASEFYAKLYESMTRNEFEAYIGNEEFRIIGENSLTNELIIQTKQFSPKYLKKTFERISMENSGLVEVRLIPWEPQR